MKIVTINSFSGLYSTQKYKSGTSIHILKGTILQKPTRTSIEIDTDKHIEDEIGKYMNHSFSPNCKIENGEIITIDDIEVNDELTFNYNETESKLAYPFQDTHTGIMVSGKNTNKNDTNQ